LNYGYVSSYKSSVQRQALAVRMSLSFCRLRVFAFEVGERRVRRFVSEPDSEDPLTSEFADHPEAK